MNYKFPDISHIDHVLPAIAGRDEFIVVDKGDYKVINYAFASNDTFPPVAGPYWIEGKKVIKPVCDLTILRECRGLIFAPDGKLLSRRYHKFFNLGERQETLPENIDFSQPHVILEKLDGSMISPLVFGDNVRWSTKMGITDTSMQTEVFIAQNPQYTRFAKFCHKKGLTPIFEWCSRQNRIVVDHPVDQLILTAVRKTVEGTYYNQKRLQVLGFFFQIPIVKVVASSHDSIDALVTAIRMDEGGEGVVVRFKDGHMLKVKSDWYVRIHRAKEFLTSDRLKIEAILSEKVDDVLPFLTEPDKVALQEFQTELWNNINMFVMLVENIHLYIHRQNLDRKQFALSDIASGSGMIRSIIFKCWDDVDKVRPFVIDKVLKSTSSNQALEKTAEIWRDE